MKTLSVGAFVLFVLAVVFNHKVQAASQTWDGGSLLNGNWSTSTNWLGDPAAPGSTSVTNSPDVATFNAAIANGWGTSQTPIIIDSATRNVSGLSFTTAAGNYFIGTTGGNALLLSSGGSIQILSGLTAINAIQTIRAPLVLQGTTYAFTNNSANGVGGGSGTLVFGGGITGTTGATTLTLNGSNTNANRINSSIGNGSATSLAVTKSGTGTWVLSGANDYSGTTTVSAGVLNIRHGRALGSIAGGTSVTSGAALQLQGGITTLTEALTLNGTGISTNGALRNISGDNTYAGLITLGSAAQINSDAGTLTLSHSGTITGATFGLTVSGGGNTIINSIIGTTSGTLSKNGSGTLTLFGANTYTGATTVSAGVLNIRHASALGDVTAGTSVTLSGASLQLQGGITTLAEALYLNGNGISNTGALRNLRDDNTYAGILTLGNSTRINSDAGTLTLSNTGTITGGAIGLTVGGAGNTTIQSILGAGMGSLNKDGSGTLTVAGASTYTGATAVTGGTLKAGVASVAGVSGAFGINSAFTLANVAGVTLDLNGFNTQIGALSGGGGAGGNVTLGSSTLTVAGSTTPQPYAGIISGAGGALTKSGSGTLTLTGANTYTGATTVSSGTLQLGNGGTTGSLSTSSAITNNATLIFNRSNTVTQGADFASVISGTGAVRQNGPGMLTFSGSNAYTGRTTVNGGTLVLAFGTVASNIIASSSALTLGGGTLQLTGTGTQSVNGLTTTTGTGSRIVLGSNQTLTLGALVAPGAGVALNFNTASGGANGATVGTGIVVLSGQTAGSAINPGFTVTDSGGFGLATVNGANQVVRLTTTTLLPASGATSATNYRIDNNAAGASAAGSSNLTITSSEAALSITVDTTAASGAVTLGSGIVLSTNIWNFGGTGSNTWQISGSTGGAGLKAVASGNAIEINNYNTGKVTLNSPILANGSNAVTVKGTGTMVFGGVNTYTGATTIRGGTLEVASGGSITHTSASLVVGNSSGDNGMLNLTGGTVDSMGATIGSSAGSSGTATVSSGSWTNGFLGLTIGSSGTGALSISGGTVSSTGGSILGGSAGGSGIATVSSGSWTSTTLTVGDSGTGVLNITGGTVSGTSGTLGWTAGGSGTVTVSDGRWTNSSFLTVGSSGSGVLNISGTGSVSNTSGTIASSAGSSGRVTVNSGSWTNSGGLTVGNGGRGVLIITGGTVSNTTGLLGSGSGEDVSGMVTVSSGNWNNSGLLTIGASGAGVLNVNGGSVSSAGGTLGSQTNGSGTATVSSGSWTNSSNLSVGSSGRGELIISGGSVTSLNGFIGEGDGSSGTATVSGGSWTNSGSLAVGNLGIGVLNVTGSGVVHVGGVAGTGTLTLGSVAGSSGTLNLGSGGMAGTVNAAIVTGGSGVAVNFNHTGNYTFVPTLAGSLAVNKLGSGTTVLTTTNTYTGVTTVNVNGGTLQFAKQTALYNNNTASWTATNLVVNSGGTAAFNVGGAGEFTTAHIDLIKDLGTAFGGFLGGSALGIDTTNALGTVIYGGVIADTNAGANSLGLAKLGTGTLELTGANTYTGATTINGGTLRVNNNNGSNTGFVGGALTVNSGGTVAIGPATGRMLTVGGGLTVGAGGTLQVQLGGSTLNAGSDIRGFETNLAGIAGSIISMWEGTSPGTNHDRILSNDAVSPVINGVVSVNLNGYTPVFGDVFDLLDWTNLANSISGTTTFDFTGAVLEPGLAFNTQLFARNGFIVVVPEPSRSLLLLLGIVVMLLRRQR